MPSEHPVMRSTGAGPTNKNRSGLKPRTRPKRPRYKPKVIIEQVDILDPDGSGGRISVSRNRRVDILAVEHSKHRISRGARDLGRLLQHVYERADRTPGFPRQWQPYVDRTFSSDRSIMVGWMTRRCSAPLSTGSSAKLDALRLVFSGRSSRRAGATAR